MNANAKNLDERLRLRDWRYTLDTSIYDRNWEQMAFDAMDKNAVIIAHENFRLAINLFAIKGMKIGTAIRQWTKMTDDSHASADYRIMISYRAYQKDVIIEDEVSSEH